MAASRYSEFRFWSPLLGCEAVRLSMVDELGGEFYRIMARGSAREWRATREEALDDLAAAIAVGREPGEVA